MDPIKRPVKPSQWEILEGQIYVRRQIDVNGASRVWYFVDATVYGVKQKRRGGRIIIDQIYFGHPKQTE